MTLIALLTALAGVAACRPSLEASPDTLIECGNDAECPKDFTCGVSSGLCIPDSLNTPPALTIGTVPRHAARPAVPVTIVDSENEDVALVIEISFDTPDGAQTWFPIDPSLVQPDPTELSSAAPNNAHTLLITVASSTLSSTGVDVQNSLTDDGSVQGTLAVVRFEPEAYFRITPTDASGNIGAPVVSEAFSVGNTPPEVNLTGWPMGVSFQRYVPVEYFLSDDAADPAIILVEFRSSDLDPFVSATIIAGLPDNGPVATTADGEVRLALWDTLPDLGIVTDATPTVRVRATDSLDGSLSFLSPWTVLPTPPVSN